MSEHRYKTLKEVDKQQLEIEMAFNHRPRRPPPAHCVDPITRAEREYQDWLFSSPAERMERTK